MELNCEPGVAGAAWLALQPHAEIPASTVVSNASLATTETKNPRSEGWEHLATHELVQLFVDEESCVQEALQGAIDSLSCAVDAVTKKLSAGGRLFYVGAGTSGRLGMLDAAEMPPTFGVPTTLVQGILAGGVDALVHSSEAKEDDEELAVSALRERGLTAQDVVCAISASGTTRFAWGALREARRLGALSLLIACSVRAGGGAPLADIEVLLLTGPELLTGSTRLKAGTATKVALNILSTGVMIRLDRVRGNSMVCLRPTNQKLRQRAARILRETFQISESEAWGRLEAAQWNLSVALASGPKGSNAC